jgi:GxxExxY protein
MPVVYEGHRLDCGYRIDLLVEKSVVVELTAVDAIDAIFAAQVLTYLKLSGCRTGLLINFNVALLRDGIRRFVLG